MTVAAVRSPDCLKCNMQSLCGPLNFVRIHRQEFETELKTASDDAADDVAKSLEEKKEEMR